MGPKPKKNKIPAAPPLKPAPEVREEIRDYIKNERDTILRKWQSLQESLNSEEKRRQQFLVRHEAIKMKTMPPVIMKFIRTLKRAVRTTMIHKGGTPFSIVRSMFLYWDQDKSGELGDEELEKCMLSLGVKMDPNDRAAIIQYYDSGKGSGEMNYNKLLDDLLIDEPTLTQTMGMPKDSPTEDELRFKTEEDNFAVMPDLVKDFIEAVRSVLKVKMSNEGGTELSHLRHSFLMFDHDYSNALDEEELTMAMHRNMGLQISKKQALEVVRYYDRKGTGQMNYHLLLADVLKGQPLMLQHPEYSARTIAHSKKALTTNPFIIKPFLPHSNKKLEQFKTQLLDTLGKKIKTEGGSLRSWVSKAFLSWDPHLSGKITRWQDLQGAIRLLGLNISEDEAKNLMNIFDKNGNGEMDYRVFMDSIFPMNTNFICDADNIVSARSLAKFTGPATSRCPADVTMTIRKIRRGAEVYAEKSENSVEPKDILHGTMMKYDINRCGRLRVGEFKKVLHDLKISSSDEEISKLTLWFDSNGSNMVDYALLTKQLYGDDVLTRPLSLPSIKETTSHDIKDTNKQVLVKVLHRHKQILAEKLKIESKMQSIEKQRQALLEHRKSNKN